MIEALRVDLITESGAVGVGFGTATPMITGDTVASMQHHIDHTIGPGLLGCDVGAAIDAVLATAGQCPSGAAAVDLALRQLSSRSDAGHRVHTSVTISADTADTMVAQALRRIELGFDTIKLKLGVDPENDAQRLCAVVGAVEGRATVWVDANQGWTRFETLHIVETAHQRGCAPALLEQPVDRDDVDSLAWIASQVPMPVYADESARSLATIDRIADLGSVSGVNIKFMKFGGWTPAASAVDRCRSHGLAVLVGSMMEHPASVAAAVAFASALPEPVHDLDAGWWIANQSDVTYDGSYVCT